MELYAAFLMGLAGSLHCLGMCGPIAFALPVRTSHNGTKLLKYLLYNFGRIITYASLGLAIGIAGKGLALAGLQQMISIVAGILILISVLVLKNPSGSSFFSKLTFFLSEKLKKSFQFYFKKTGFVSLFILGLLNGLLPCGMVYMAMLGALATGNSFSGAGFMAAFGLGTMPMMLSVSLSGSLFSIRMKNLFYNITPYIACIVGILLILRGLNLNIPYVSPGDSCCQHNCH